METVWEGAKWGIGLFISVMIVVVILAIIMTIYEEVQNIKKDKEMLHGKKKGGKKNGNKRKHSNN